MTCFEVVESTPDDAPDVVVTFTTEGDEVAAESVQMHVHDAVRRALQAVTEKRPPDECQGYCDIDWERRFEVQRGEDGDEQ